jgi:hypothetical protein
MGGQEVYADIIIMQYYADSQKLCTLPRKPFRVLIVV